MRSRRSVALGSGDAGGPPPSISVRVFRGAAAADMHCPAIAVEPSSIICGESVSGLEVSLQAQVLNLLKDLQQRCGLTYIFISHDLSVVKFMADMMAVMNAGKLVEFGPSENIYA